MVFILFWDSLVSYQAMSSRPAQDALPVESTGAFLSFAACEFFWSQDLLWEPVFHISCMICDHVWKTEQFYELEMEDS